MTHTSAAKSRSGFPGPFVLPILLLGVLLSFPAQSVRGALNGLLLWFHVVLPTLAPFMICTQMITALGGAQWMMRPFGPLLQKLFGLSPSGAYILLCGLLCGYPLGAKMCADFLRRGNISEKEAACLLAICNHPSPMFLSGYVRAQLPFPVSPVLLFTSLYLPILPISFVARHIYGKRSRFTDPVLTDPSPRQPNDTPSLEDVIASACETMVIIGGYIMLFSILVVWIQEFPVGSSAARAFLRCGRNHDRSQQPVSLLPRQKSPHACHLCRGLRRILRNLPDQKRHPGHRTFHPAVSVLEAVPCLPVLSGYCMPSVTSCPLEMPGDSSLRLAVTTS